MSTIIIKKGEALYQTVYFLTCGTKTNVSWYHCPYTQYIKIKGGVAVVTNGHLLLSAKVDSTVIPDGIYLIGKRSKNAVTLCEPDSEVRFPVTDKITDATAFADVTVDTLSCFNKSLVFADILKKYAENDAKLNFEKRAEADNNHSTCKIYSTYIDIDYYSTIVDNLEYPPSLKIDLCPNYIRWMDIDNNVVALLMVAKNCREIYNAKQTN